MPCYAPMAHALCLFMSAPQTSATRMCVCFKAALFRVFFPLRVGSSSFTGIKSCIPVGTDKQRKLSRSRKWWEQWQTDTLYTERVLKVLQPKHCFGPVTVDSKEPQGCKAMTQSPPQYEHTGFWGKKPLSTLHHLKCSPFAPGLTFLALY